MKGVWWMARHGQAQVAPQLSWLDLLQFFPGALDNNRASLLLSFKTAKGLR